MIKTMLKLAAAAGTGVVLARNWPDIKRYVTMKRASASSHPEMIPASGRTAYPQSHDAGAIDGTGDFDSAQRGGPALS
jgi:hypothetical protein